MPNLAHILKEEIRRLARKEVKSETGVTRRMAAAHRREIAALKRQVDDLQKRVSFLEGQERRRIAKPKDLQADTEQVRFSPRWLKAHRERLDLSAADYAKLVGVSPLTIYHWEHGKSKPRQQQLVALAGVRKLKKREALRRLEVLAR